MKRKTKKKLTKKQVRRNYKKRATKMALASRKLKAMKAKKEDVFADDNTPVNADDAMITHPGREEVLDEISQLDSFKDWQKEMRGNSLTFGDY